MRNDDHIDSDDSHNGKQRTRPLSTNLKVAIGITAGMLLGAIAMSIFIHKGEPQEAEISKADSAQAQSISTQANSTQGGSGAAQAATPIGAFPQADPAAAALVLQAQQQATQSQDQQLAPSETSEDITSDRMGIQSVQASGDPQTLSETVSGYPIYYSGAPKAVDAGADNPNWNVTRSGLVGNPCVDPPSTQGRAYQINGAY